jgi:predicted DNA-binding transcriptional regulator AlpA
MTDHFPDQAPSAEVELELLTQRDVLKFFGGSSRPIHVSTLYRGVASGIYPRPINIAPNAVRWIASECRAAQQRMVTARDKPKPKPQGAARRGRPRRVREATAEAVK